MGKVWTVVCLSLLIGIANLANTARGEDEKVHLSRFSWAAKEKAHVYRGTVTLSGQSIKFQTFHLSVVLPSKTPLEVTALNKYYDPIGNVEIREEPLVDTSGTLPTQKDDVAAYLEVIDELLEQEGALRLKPGFDLVPEPQPYSYNWTAVALFGLGNETLRMNGGVADYSGKSFTADTYLVGGWEEQGGFFAAADRPWAAEAAVDFHNHYVTVTQDNTLDGTTETRTEKRLRIRFHLVGLYKISLSDSIQEPKGIAIEGGLGSFRTNILRLREPTTGKMEFGDAQLNGPRIGVRYYDSWSMTHRWEARFALLPIASGQDHEGSRYDGGFFWTYLFSDETHGLGAITFSSEQANGSVDCGNISNCSGTSTSKGGQFVISIGAEHLL